MKSVFAINRDTRAIFLNFLSQYSVEKLTQIPEGFSNHLLWNINHCIVTQQLLIYKLSHQTLLISENWVEKYKKGSKPATSLFDNELETTKELLLQTIIKTEEDFNNAVFKTFDAYQTSTGFEINNLNDALQFNNFHEGVHLGLMMQLRKFLK